MIAPRDPFSDVVDERRKIMPDWYSWLNELTGAANSGGGGGPPLPGGIVLLSDFITASGDQTANVNAAFATLAGTGGTLIWDVVGLINTTDTIVVGANGFPNNTGPTSYISILGTSAGDLCGINYQGPTDRPGLLFCKNKFFYVKNLHIGNTGGFGTSIGIALGGQGTSGTGTQTLAGLFENISISGWATGIQAGANFGEASEILFNSIQSYGNDVGFNAVGFNCLDFEFHMWSMDNNRIGINSGASDGFHVYGGSSTQSHQCDFYIEGNGHSSINNFRCENLLADACFVSGNFGGDVAIRNCLVQASATKYAIKGPLNRIAVYDSGFDSYIQVTDFCSNCTLIDNKLPLDPTNRLPFIRSTDQGVGPVKFKCWNNANIDGSGFANDCIGVNKYAGLNVDPFQVLAYEPLTHTVVENGSYPTDSYALFGSDYQALCRVRQLSEGPIVGSRNVPARSALTNAATVSGKVLHFAATPSYIVPNMTVEGTNIPFNAYVVAYDATTITISANVTGGGVASGATINFWNLMAVPTPGKNLRVTGTFAGGTSVNVLFKRSLTVTGNPFQSQNLTAVTGRFYPTDVGKPIRIIANGNAGWTDMYGNIWQYIDSTHVLFQPGPGQVDPVISVNRTAEIGEDEPDANYIVAGLCGDAAGTFWVSGLTTTGFTLNASAASTANVVALIVR